MKLYTITIVRSDSAKEFEVSIFTSIEAAMDYAYATYCITKTETIENGDIDEDSDLSIMPFENFSVALLNREYICIQCFDYHILIEYQCHDVDLSGSWLGSMAYNAIGSMLCNDYNGNSVDDICDYLACTEDELYEILPDLKED